MLRDGAPQQFLDRLDSILEPPIMTRAERLRDEWDDDEAFDLFENITDGFEQES